MFYALPNLSAQVVEPCTPWDWVRKAPERCWGSENKEVRDSWACAPGTQHQMYSAYEGLNTSLRVSEQNPPLKLSALIGDYDLKIGLVELEAAILRLSIKPNWLEQTLSDHWRAIWLLERSIPLASISHSRHLVQNIASLAPVEEIPGIDKPALISFSRYYTNSGRWRQIHDKPIAWDAIQGWLVKTSSTFGWAAEMSGYEVDFKTLAGRMAEKYPRFVEWSGEFVLGAQGPSFWVEGSTSPKSASVREKGIYTFSQHAAKSYYSWADLCGEAWMQAYQTNRIGAAVKDIYYDDKNFFILSPTTENWLQENKEGLLNELLVARGLRRESGKKSTGKQHSEIEEAVNYIRHQHRVDGAAPFAFFQKGLIDWNGGRYLNTHTRDVIKPAKTGEWGVDFPFFSAYWDQFFLDSRALTFFISWMSRFYKGCYLRKPCSGQGIFISGPVNTGKTMMSRGFLSRLFGGHADPKNWLLGLTPFNSELYQYALWAIDDGSIGTSAQVHRYFTEMVKNQAANKDSVSHAKFGKPSQVANYARLLVTLNNDARSRRMIPRLDMSLMEKIMLFQSAPRSISLPDYEELQRIIARELPFFARFLLNFEIPEMCKDEDPRYGVISYHDPELVASANMNDSAFIEVLDHWMMEHFTTTNPKDDFWEGSSLQLRQEILRDPTMTDTMRAFDLEEIKRRLVNLSSGTEFHIEVISGEHRMKFRIHRGETCPHKTKPQADIPQSEGSKFEKK